MCRSDAKQGDHHFCGKTCADEAASKGPIILEVPEGHIGLATGALAGLRAIDERLTKSIPQ